MNTKSKGVKRVDGHLSKEAQKKWPSALVFVIPKEGGEDWILRRDGQEDIGLGGNFGHAKQTISAMISAERSAEKGRFRHG